MVAPRAPQRTLDGPGIKLVRSPKSSSPELPEVETGRSSYALSDPLTPAVYSILRTEKPCLQARLLGALQN